MADAAAIVEHDVKKGKSQRMHSPGTHTSAVQHAPDFGGFFLEKGDGIFDDLLLDAGAVTDMTVGIGRLNDHRTVMPGPILFEQKIFGMALGKTLDIAQI